MYIPVASRFPPGSARFSLSAQHCSTAEGRELTGNVRMKNLGFSPQLLRYFDDNSRRGRLEPADRLSEAENPVCGDWLVLTARVETQQLAQVRFQARGCVAATACAAALAEALEGLTWEQADGLDLRVAILQRIERLPEASGHAIELAVTAGQKLIQH